MEKEFDELKLVFGAESSQLTFSQFVSLSDFMYERLLNIPGITIPVAGRLAEMRQQVKSQQQEQSTQYSKTDEPMIRLLMLLYETVKHPNQAILDEIVKNYQLAARLAVVSTKDQAADLYRDASRVPKASTISNLRRADFIIDGPVPGAYSVGATFLKAFDHGVPIVVKVLDSSEVARRELEYIENLHVPPLSPFEVGLVPVTEWKGPARSSLPLSAKGIKGMLKETTANIVAGAKVYYMVMPFFPATLGEFPLPVPAAYVLRYGKDVLTGLEHCWNSGYGFCDCKPTNIFISSEGRAYLGDYGGLTLLETPYSETTPHYIPTDYLGDSASEEMDRWMLIVSLLESLETSRFTSALHIDLILQKVAAVADAQLKSFLLDLVPRAKKL